MTTTDNHIREVERFNVEVSNPTDMGRHLEAAYGARLRLIRDPRHDDRTVLTHSRVDVGSFAIEQVSIPGEVEASPDPLNKIMAVWVTAGRLDASCEGTETKALPGEIMLISQPDLPHHSRAEDLEATVLLLSRPLVTSVATGLPSGQAAAPIRFTALQPVDSAAAQQWKDTVSYVRDIVLADDSMATPLVLGQAARLLAAVTLATFPNTAAAVSSAHDRNEHRPVLLRRAVDYIETNAQSDLSINDIADAVHVTPRAVQYMFRRHMGITPLQYARRMRLHYAHQDLINGDRAHNTVTEVAAKWGFAHTGRFAVLYRQTYGQSPHATLRGE